MLWFSFTQFRAWMGHLRIFFLNVQCVCAPLCTACVCMTHCQSFSEREVARCWQADGLSHCLLRSSTSHPITPASSYQPVVCHSLCSRTHTFSFPLHVSWFLYCSICLSVCLVGSMSSVRCNPSWQICCGTCVGIKPVKWCLLLLFSFPFHIPFSVLVAVCTSKAPACLLRGRKGHSAVSKGLLGWNLLSKDTWQLFTISWDRTFTDPTFVPVLLLSGRQSDRQRWVSASLECQLGVFQCWSLELVNTGVMVHGV